jgi:hypothetical protein
MSSAIISLLGCARPAQPNPLWQLLRCKRQSDRVLTWIGQLPQPIEQAQGLKHGGINADADAMVARLDPAQGGAAGESPLGDDLSRQPPPLACVSDILAKLAEHPADRDGWMMGCWHSEAFVFRYLDLT